MRVENLDLTFTGMWRQTDDRLVSKYYSRSAAKEPLVAWRFFWGHSTVLLNLPLVARGPRAGRLERVPLRVGSDLRGHLGYAFRANFPGVFEESLPRPPNTYPLHCHHQQVYSVMI